MKMMSEQRNSIPGNKIVSRQEWIAARQELLRKEKESTRLSDLLSAERRKLPWVKVEKNYVFDAPGGKETLADLFDGRSQLVIYHFMFGPDWKEGCPSCSFVSDHIEGALTAPGSARRHNVDGLASPAHQDRSVQAADGLAIQVGIVVRERLQC